jgi:hypothetical protein
VVKADNKQVVEDLIEGIENIGCSCEAMVGYQCGIHNLVIRLRDELDLTSVGPDLDEGLANSYFLNPELWEALVTEVRRGVVLYGNYDSPKQALWVIQSEVYEVWAEVRTGNLEALRTEALQVAATAIRLVEELDQGLGGANE